MKDQKSLDSSQILLFHTVHSLSIDISDILKKLEYITGKHATDIRFRLLGQGIGMLPVKHEIPEASQLIETMNHLGIRAAFIDEPIDYFRYPLPLAKNISITPLYIIFKDDKNQPLFTLDKTSEILMVLADLSGVFQDMALSEMAYKGIKHRRFQQVLSKAAPFVFQPVVDIFDIHSTSSRNGIRIDSRKLSYAGPNMPPLIGNKFPTVIREIISHVQCCYTDHYFGLANLTGAKPDKQVYKEGKPSVERMLIKYEHYVLAAARCGLILPELQNEPKTPQKDVELAIPPNEFNHVFIPETGIPSEKTWRILPIIVWGLIGICVVAIPFIFFSKRTGNYHMYHIVGSVLSIALILTGLTLSVFILKRLPNPKNDEPELLRDQSMSLLPSWVMKILFIGGLCITGFGMILLMRLRIWEIFF